MRSAIYPGSFDPITNGHLDIISRACKLFDKVYVCVAQNSAKKTFFNNEQRFYMTKKACEEFDNVEVIQTDKLIVNLAKELGAIAIVRGLRAVTDFEYEFQLAAGNEFIDKDIEMVFLMASSGKGFISSSSIKEFATYNVDISSLVPNCVAEEFKKKLK